MNKITAHHIVNFVFNLPFISGAKFKKKSSEFNASSVLLHPNLSYKGLNISQGHHTLTVNQELAVHIKCMFFGLP